MRASGQKWFCENVNLSLKPMKEIVPPSIIQNQFESVKELFARNVVPTYGRFMAFVRGSGSYLYDVSGRRYLDLGGGIAVCALGHANAEITQALLSSRRSWSISQTFTTTSRRDAWRRQSCRRSPRAKFSFATAAPRRMKAFTSWPVNLATMKDVSKS